MTTDARHEATLKIMRLAPVIPVLTVKSVADGVAPSAEALCRRRPAGDRSDAAHRSGA